MKDLVVATRALLLVAMVAATGLIILDAFQDDQETIISVVNESVNCTDTLGTAITLDSNSGAISFFVEVLNASFINVTNTTGLFLRPGNFTVDPIAATITCTPGGVLGASLIYNVTYRYVTGSDARTTFGDGISSVGEITSWLDIIALIIAASIILYFVFKGMGKQPGAGRY